ncbi:MAG TPA: hypothetical protein VIX81_03175 [Gammaproteobacteria bacterium]
MIIESTSPLFGGWQGPAEITACHPAARYGRPVLLVAGEPVDRLAAQLAGYRLVEANDNERDTLARGGYPLPG